LRARGITVAVVAQAWTGFVADAAFEARHPCAIAAVVETMSETIMSPKQTTNMLSTLPRQIDGGIRSEGRLPSSMKHRRHDSSSHVTAFASTFRVVVPSPSPLSHFGFSWHL
jgi:hypothetical protein